MKLKMKTRVGNDTKWAKDFSLVLSFYLVFQLQLLKRLCTFSVSKPYNKLFLLLKKIKRGRKAFFG